MGVSRTPPRLLGALMLVAVSLAGCDETRSLRWRLDFDDAATRAAADQVTARVVRGGCDGTEAVYAATLRPGTSAMSVPELEAGTYGFTARARDDATCRFVAEGCAAVELPLDDGAEVVTVLETLTDGPVDPTCSTTDAGPSDGGPDAGDGGPDPDAGACTPDGGTPSSCPLGVAPDSAWTFETTIYADPSGDDSNDGSTPALAVATLERAFALYEATGTGARIVLAAGRYTGLTELIEVGAAARPLKIEGPAGAVLDGLGGTSALLIQPANYVVLEGFTIENADRPLRFEEEAVGSQNLVIRGLTVQNGGSCIRLFSVDDFWIENNVTRGCTVGINLLGSHRGVVRNNDIAESEDGRGITAAGGSSDVLVHGNSFRDLGYEAMVGGGDSDFSYARPPDATEEAARVYFLSNVVLRAGGQTDTGGDLHGAVAFESCDGCVVANNTIIQPGGYVVSILPGNPGADLPTRDGVFVNNLVDYFPADLGGYVEVASGEVSPETFTFGANLFHPRSSGSFDPTPPSGATVVAPEITVPMGEEIFVDFGGGDYRPLPCGPADGAGAPLEYAAYDPVGAAAPVGDHDDRCFTDPPSVGAREAY